MSTIGISRWLALALTMAAWGTPQLSLAQSQQRTAGTPASVSTPTDDAASRHWSTPSHRPFSLLREASPAAANTLQSAPSPAESQRRRLEKRERIDALKDSLKTIIKEWSTAKDKHSLPQDPIRRQPPTSTVDSEPSDPTAVPQHNDQPSTADVETQRPDTEGDLTDIGLALAGDVLVDGPVDRVALADNLYAIGEYTLAREMYARVDRSTLPRDQQFWVQYQTASCLRETGHTKEAKKQYRIVAGQEDADWLQRSSIWWLDMIDQRQELQQQLAATQEVIDRERKRHHGTDTR